MRNSHLKHVVARRRVRTFADVRERDRRVLVTALVVLGLFVVLRSGASYAIPVFINEVHYDNLGADSGESVEIAGPAGTDLSGWTLVLYNGANGNVYDTIALSGVIGDEQNGYGTSNFAAVDAQNGSPDGIALVNVSNNVVQFLSYEGAFMANNGPAAGQTSTDIGVSEPTFSPTGFSVQLVGAGRDSTDFSWTGPLPATPGTLNTPGITDLFFSEYVEGSGNNKALELYNGTGSDVDLSNYAIEIYFNGSTNPGSTLTLGGTLSDGDVWVGADDGAVQALLDLADDTFTQNFFNGDDLVALRNLLTDEMIDNIGVFGEDPGSQWSGGGVGTQNSTLRRKGSVLFGDYNRADAFDPSDQWNGFASDTFDGLGSHTVTGSLPQQTILPASTGGPLPEPGTLVLFGIGLTALRYGRRRAG